MSEKLDEVEWLARWLYVAAHATGKVELVRQLIRDAMNETVGMYGLPNEDEPDDAYSSWEFPDLLSRFAAAWDESDREERQNG